MNISNQLSLTPLIIFASFIFAGCSNQQLYQAGQEYQRSVCSEKSASSQQLNDCLNANQKGYKEYDMERKEIIDK